MSKFVAAIIFALALVLLSIGSAYGYWDTFQNWNRSFWVESGGHLIFNGNLSNAVNYNISKVFTIKSGYVAPRNVVRFGSKVFITAISYSIIYGPEPRYAAIIQPDGNLYYFKLPNDGLKPNENETIMSEGVGIYIVAPGGNYYSFKVYYHPYTRTYLLSKPLQLNDMQGKVAVFKGYNVRVYVVGKNGEVLEQLSSGERLDSLDPSVYPIRLKIAFDVTNKYGVAPGEMFYFGIVPSGILSGRITLDGKPIQAKVYLYDKDGRLIDLETADGNGRYVFHGLHDNETYYLHVFWDGYEMGEFNVTVPNPEYDISFKSSTCVSIKVVDPNGNPIKNASISVEGVRYNTTADGLARVFLVAGNVYTVKVSKEGYANLTLRFVPHWHQNLTLVLAPLSNKTSGVVYEDYAATPVRHVRVTLGNATVYTNDFGYFEFNKTGPVNVSKTGYVVASKITDGTVSYIFLSRLNRVRVVAESKSGIVSSFNLSVLGSDYSTVYHGSSNEVYLRTGVYYFVVTAGSMTGTRKELIDGNKTVTVELHEVKKSTSTEITYSPVHAVTIQILKNDLPYVCDVLVKDESAKTTITLHTDSEGKIVFQANSTHLYTININNGERIISLYPSLNSYVFEITPINISSQQAGPVVFNITRENGTIIVQYKTLAGSTKSVNLVIYNYSSSKIIYNVTTHSSSGKIVYVPKDNHTLLLKLKIHNTYQTVQYSTVAGNGMYKLPKLSKLPKTVGLIFFGGLGIFVALLFKRSHVPIGLTMSLAVLAMLTSMGILPLQTNTLWVLALIVVISWFVWWRERI